MHVKLCLGTQLASATWQEGSLSSSCPMPHGQYSLCIELGGGQMKETDAVLLDWELVRNPQCEGWKTVRGCGRVQAGSATQPGGSEKVALGK